MSKAFPFQAIQFSQTVLFRISTFFVYSQLNSKIVLFQTTQFSIITQFSSIRPINRTLSGATSLGMSEPGSDGNEGVLRIPQSSNITGTSPSDCLCHIQDTRSEEVLPISREAVDVFYNPNRLGKDKEKENFEFKWKLKWKTESQQTNKAINLSLWHCF